MARSRKSHVSDEEKTKSSKPRLIPAYSAKVDGHKYVIYATYARPGETIGRVLVLKFLATYAARDMVVRLIAKDDYEWKLWLDRDQMIVTSRGVMIRAHKEELKEIIEYEPTDEELEWRDDRLVASCGSFLYGRGDDDMGLRSGDHKHAGREDVHDEGGGDNVPKRSVNKARREKQPRSEPKPKISTDDYVSANDIAKKLKVEGREVRGVLRALKLTRPAHGWSWPKDEAGKVEKKVLDQMKIDTDLRNKGKKKS